MIWPFKRKEEKIPEPYEEPWLTEWKDLKARYPVGRKFQYLGREMVVFSHRESFTDKYGKFPPAVCCEYADGSGVLREWEFPLGSWNVLE